MSASVRSARRRLTALSYGGGPFEGNKFQKIVRPSSGLVLNGLFDKWYTYPVTQRNYIVSQQKRPSFSEAVLQAFEQNRVSKSRVVTAQNEADAKEAEARGVARQRQALNEGGALSPEFIEATRAQAELGCAQKADKCTMVVTQGQTGVNVNTGP